MKIGDTIYSFDPNHREYERDKNGRAKGGAIYIKHWREEPIIGETKVSWLIGWEHNPTKVNKKKLANGELHNYKATWNEVVDLAWVHDNRYRISEAVKRMDDIVTLRAIDDLLEASHA